MFCQKCGKENANKNEFCLYCGTKIDKEKQWFLDIPPKYKQLLSNKMLIVIVSIVAVISICFYFVLFNTPNIEGKYIYTYSDSSDMYIEFTQSKTSENDGTFTDWLGFAGIYKIDDNKLQTFETTIETEDSYIIFKNYLLDEGSKYNGLVPPGKHFDATFKSNDSYEKYIFKSDGTMSFNGQTSSTKNGTYERKGEAINYQLDGLDVNYKAVIYQNELYNSGYYKK